MEKGRVSKSDNVGKAKPSRDSAVRRLIAGLCDLFPTQKAVAAKQAYETKSPDAPKLLGEALVEIGKVLGFSDSREDFQQLRDELAVVSGRLNILSERLMVPQLGSLTQDGKASASKRAQVDNPKAREDVSEYVLVKVFPREVPLRCFVVSSAMVHQLGPLLGKRMRAGSDVVHTNSMLLPGLALEADATVCVRPFSGENYDANSLGWIPSREEQLAWNHLADLFGRVVNPLTDTMISPMCMVLGESQIYVSRDDLQYLVMQLAEKSKRIVLTTNTDRIFLSHEKASSRFFMNHLYAVDLRAAKADLQIEVVVASAGCKEMTVDQKQAAIQGWRAPAADFSIHWQAKSGNWDRFS